MHFTIICAACGHPITEFYELQDHATCAPPSEEVFQAQAQAMERRFHQLQTRLKLAAAGVVLSHGHKRPRRTRRRRRH